MGKSIIIDCKTGVSRFKQCLYNNNLCKMQENHKNLISLGESEIEIREIPLSSKNNLKNVKKFVENLKKEDIDGVILSQNVRVEREICNFLEENLNFFSGTTVTDYFFEEIYNKYLLVNNKKDFEAELVIFSDNPQKTYDFLNKICKKLKNVYIVSDNYEGFDGVIKKIYEEFGFYIYFTKKTGNVFLKDRIYINLSENTDFFLEEAEKNNIIIINLSGKSILSKSMLNTFVFKLSKKFKDVSSYFKYFDQECIEFFANVMKKSKAPSSLKEFINDEDVRFKKICSKNH